MRIFKAIDRIRYIDYLIRTKQTGNPNNFSSKLGISRSLLFLELEYLRQMGAPIIWNRTINSYEYEFEIEIKADFAIKQKD